MRKRMIARLCAVAAVALAALSADTSAAVDLGGTAWTFTGRERLVVRRMGRDRSTTTVSATFDEGGAFGIDQEGNEGSGTWTTRGRKAARLRITLDGDSVAIVEEWLASWIEDEAEKRGSTVSVTVDVTRYRIGGTVNRRGTRAQILTRYWFRATDSISGTTVRGTYRGRVRGTPDT